jgi:hypothetical protein
MEWHSLAVWLPCWGRSQRDRYSHPIHTQGRRQCWYALHQRIWRLWSPASSECHYRNQSLGLLGLSLIQNIITNITKTVNNYRRPEAYLRRASS